MLFPWDLDGHGLPRFVEELKNAENDREATEIWEEFYLHPLAARSRGKHKTRIPPDWRDPCPYRTAFQRDEARIIHSVAFRRLMQKTQAFISPEPDYFRTRLTHTLEVFQISKTIARALRLNEDLVGAIALGHDLGHTPFGHEGELALQEILGQAQPEEPLTGRKAEIAEKAKAAKIVFDHHVQSWLIITATEGILADPLNLTEPAAYGILRHSRGRDRKKGEPDETLEEQVVKWADDIAWINHDINDAIEAGIFSYSEIGLESLERWDRTARERIDRMLRDVINSSADRLRHSPEKPIVDGQRMIGGSSDLEKELKRLQRVIADKLWKNVEVERRNKQARMYIQDLFEYFVDHPDKLPEQTQRRLKDAAGGSQDEVLIRALKDHISGVTDKYALDKYREHLGPATPFRCGEAGVEEFKCYWQVDDGSPEAEEVGDFITLNFGLAEGASIETKQNVYDVYFLRQEDRREPQRFETKKWMGKVEIVEPAAHSCRAKVIEIKDGARVKPGDVLLRHEPE